MKERYESLELEIILFESEDVITTSPIDDGDTNEYKNLIDY